jgi:hypothetical protein
MRISLASQHVLPNGRRSCLKKVLTNAEKCGIIEIQKKAGYRIASTIALHRSVRALLYNRITGTQRIL